MSRGVLRVAVALALFAVLVALRVSRHVPQLPNPLTLELLLEPGEAGRSDPLITSGRTLTGDFLSLRYLDAETVQFAYDHWGYPRIESRPVRVVPGKSLSLIVTLPAFDQMQGYMGPPDAQVRVVCNGTTILDAPGRFFIREPSRLFFGENPIGGTACGPALHGRILDFTGRELRGGPERLFTRRAALLDWIRTLPHQAALLLLFSLGVGFRGDRLVREKGALLRAAQWARVHRGFTVSALGATVIFTWLVTYGTFRFSSSDIFGAFYDYQAASLLRGRLDVPEDAITGEAFEARGKLYGYFGPTPALLRLPFVATGFRFGRLSQLFMVGYFAASLVASYLLFQHARARGGDAGARPAPGLFAVLILVGSVGLGSTLFFVGSRSFMYHEAILAGITFGLWSAWCTLHYLATRRGAWWTAAFVCGVLSLHARPPTGLFALTLLGVAVVFVAGREWREGRWRLPGLPPRLVGLALLCGVGVLSLNGLAWLKFRTFDAAPLRLSRPYQDGLRLAHIQGKSFHLANIPYNVDCYLVRRNFHFESGFPWIYFGARTPMRWYPHAKIDLPDHTIALPYSMPSLFALATLGCALAAVLAPHSRPDIAALWLAIFPMTVALFAAIATAQRYTGDFCPFLIAAGAYGLAAIERLANPARTVARMIAGLLTVLAVGVTMLVTLHYQGEMLWGMPDELRQDYAALRQRVDEFFRHKPAAP